MFLNQLSGELTEFKAYVSQKMKKQLKTAVTLESVTKIFDSGENSVVALDNVSLQIRENEFFTLLGPSGCGKTTLLRLIAGFENPTKGRIILYEEDITFLPPYSRSVNTVFQNYALFPHMTVEQNIAFGLQMLGKSKTEVANTVRSVLQLVRMQELAKRRTTEISGGQQQRVALARALAPKPRVLLLDESLSALDYKLRQEMQLELKRLQHETGITFIFVTHDQEEALTMSDRMAVINEGRVLQIGSPSEIYNFPREKFVAEFIGDTNFLEAEVIRTKAESATLCFQSGMEISLSADNALTIGDTVTVAVRPEQAILTGTARDASIRGVVRNMVYMGTHTHYIIKISDDSEFTAYVQNLRGHEPQFPIGSEVGIVFEESAMQILLD